MMITIIIITIIVIMKSPEVLDSDIVDGGIMWLANLLSITSQTQYHHHCYHWHGMVIMIIIDATP